MGNQDIESQRAAQERNRENLAAFKGRIEGDFEKVTNWSLDSLETVKIDQLTWSHSWLVLAIAKDGITTQETTIVLVRLMQLYDQAAAKLETILQELAVGQSNFALVVLHTQNLQELRARARECRDQLQRQHTVTEITGEVASYTY